MFRYDNSEEMKVFLDRVAKCENEQEREMMEQIKHYLDYPEQLSAIHEAESFLSVKLGMKNPPEDIVCKIAEQMYEEFEVERLKVLHEIKEFIAKNDDKEIDWTDSVEFKYV